MMLPRGADKEVPSYTHSLDAGAAWANLALQATRSGWAAHGMAGFDVSRTAAELGVPADYRVEAAIAIGRPGDKSLLPESAARAGAAQRAAAVVAAGLRGQVRRNTRSLRRRPIHRSADHLHLAWSQRRESIARNATAGACGGEVMGWLLDGFIGQAERAPMVAEGTGGARQPQRLAGRLPDSCGCDA